MGVGLLFPFLIVVIIAHLDIFEYGNGIVGEGGQ
jgi:hypothetical protein